MQAQPILDGIAVSITPRLLSIPDGAIYSATSRSTLYAAQAAGELKFVKVNNSTRVEVDELDRWIDQKTQAARASDE